MLGILGVVALVLGAFIAGGGAFDWEFLFSDGYREHPWVRSTGREGARGLMMLFGSLLVIGGFVSQVVDAASKPVSVAAVLPDSGSARFDTETATSAEGSTEDSPTFGPATRDSVGPRAVAGPTVANPSSASPKPGGPAVEKTGAIPKPPVDTTEPVASSASIGQAMTISSPDVVVEENQTVVIMQYRFERGYKPLAGSQYHWIVSFLGVAHEITFDAEAMQKQGQLTHLFSDTGGGFQKHWSTWLEIETEGRRNPVSNTLEITGDDVQSHPLTTTP